MVSEETRKATEAKEKRVAKARAATEKVTFEKEMAEKSGEDQE